MAYTSPEYQRDRYWAMKDGTWDVQARRDARRKTQCKNGHEYVEGSWKWKTSKGERFRQCLECLLTQQNKRHAERMESDPDYRIACLIRNHNVRAKKMGDPNRLSVKDIRWMWATYGSACLACGSEERREVDHVVPVSQGGLNVRSNLQPLCKSCNNKKYTFIVDYRPAA